MKTKKAPLNPREKDQRPKSKAHARPPKRFRLGPWAVGAVGALMAIAAIGAMVWAARPSSTSDANQQPQSIATTSTSADVPHVFYGST